jgi:hypothetical protein
LGSAVGAAAAAAAAEGCRGDAFDAVLGGAGSGSVLADTTGVIDLPWEDKDEALPSEVAELFVYEDCEFLG